MLKKKYYLVNISLSIVTLIGLLIYALTYSDASNLFKKKMNTSFDIELSKINDDFKIPFDTFHLVELEKHSHKLVKKIAYSGKKNYMSWYKSWKDDYDNYNNFNEKELLHEFLTEKNYNEKGFNPSIYIPLDLYNFQDSLISSDYKYYKHLPNLFLVEGSLRPLKSSNIYFLLGDHLARVKYTTNEFKYFLRWDRIFHILLAGIITFISLSLVTIIFLFISKKIKAFVKKKHLLKRMAIFIVIIFLFMLFTNPTIQDFKNNGHNNNPVREYNFLIFSIYSDTYNLHTNSARTYYVGILKNFFEKEN